MREQNEILHRAASFEAGAVSHLEFGPGLVADRWFGAHVGLFNSKTRSAYDGRPASTWRTPPVILRATSLDSNAAAAPTSSIVARRRIGERAIASFMGY